MFLREKFERPMRAAIRRKLADGADSRLSRFLFAPFKLSRLCAQVETVAAAKGDSAKLAGWDVGDEMSGGFRYYLDWIIAHWSEILQIALLILNVVDDEPEGVVPS